MDRTEVSGIFNDVWKGVPMRKVFYILGAAILFAAWILSLESVWSA
jgi:hypothetical protein